MGKVRLAEIVLCLFVCLFVVVKLFRSKFRVRVTVAETDSYKIFFKGHIKCAIDNEYGVLLNYKTIYIKFSLSTESYLLCTRDNLMLRSRMQSCQS